MTIPTSLLTIIGAGLLIVGSGLGTSFGMWVSERGDHDV